MPIQRAPVGDEPVPAESLELPDLVEQAERLDRLAADFDLVTTLGLAGFEGDAARSAMPIQRAPVGDEPVPAESLELPDLVEQAERLDRLAADFDLVTTLGLAGFEATRPAKH